MFWLIRHRPYRDHSHAKGLTEVSLFAKNMKTFIYLHADILKRKIQVTSIPQHTKLIIREITRQTEHNDIKTATLT